jgi:hypothetical protein
MVDSDKMRDVLPNGILPVLNGHLRDRVRTHRLKPSRRVAIAERTRVMGRIFISHATADVELVKLFVDLLQTGLSISHKQIFCTSLDGMRIPQGKQFVEYIREEMTKADYVVMLVTPSYYESPFCMCELGATWVRAVSCSPFVVPPINYKNLQGALYGTQVGSIDDERALNDMHDALVKLKICDPASGRWESERDSFIKRSAKVIKKLPGRTQIPASEYSSLQAKYDASQEKVTELDENIEQKDEYIEELEAMKDKADVRSAKKKYKDQQSEFDSLVEAFSASASRLPSAAIEALFYRARDEEYVLPNRYGNDQLYEDASDAAKDEYVVIEGNEVSVDDTHPEVSDAIDAMDKLAIFMEKANDGLREEFEEEHKTKFSITNRQFWRTVCDL